MNQVHKETLDHVENALPNRQGLEVEIFGMEGMPTDILEQHRNRIIQNFYQAQEERRVATGNPLPGQQMQNSRKKIKYETAEELLARFADWRVNRHNAPASGGAMEGVVPTNPSPGSFVSIAFQEKLEDELTRIRTNPTSHPHKATTRITQHQATLPNNPTDTQPMAFQHDLRVAQTLVVFRRDPTAYRRVRATISTILSAWQRLASGRREATKPTTGGRRRARRTRRGRWCTTMRRSAPRSAWPNLRAMPSHQKSPLRKLARVDLAVLIVYLCNRMDLTRICLAWAAFEMAMEDLTLVYACVVCSFDPT